MKQKYLLFKDNDAKRLIIKEFGELDKDLMSLLCEEAYGEDTIAVAVREGQAAIISAIRTDNLYPPESHAVKIANSVVALYASQDEQTIDILFDDKELLAKEQADAEQFEELNEDVDLETEDEAAELDNLLDESDIKIKTKPSTIKIAEDDSVDVEDDS